MTFLERIIETKKIEVNRLRSELSASTTDPNVLGPCRGFRNAIVQESEQSLAVVAEIKRSSPSKGLIQPNFDPVRTAVAYERSGAAAISVLTDGDYFQGAISDLTAVAKSTRLPVLRKDFIIDELQILEARLAGADAVLLICSALHPQTLVRLANYAKELGLDTLVEVHSVDEVEAAVHAEADVIGVNNRDLHTFEVSLSTTATVVRAIPNSIPILSESGIASVFDAEYVAGLGVHGVLVGESLMRQPSVHELESTLTSFRVPRLPKARDGR